MKESESVITYFIKKKLGIEEDILIERAHHSLSELDGT